MEEILDILKNLHPDIDFTTRTRLIDENILDSFDIVSIVTDISNEFDVTVPPEEIVPDNFNSAQALQAMVDRLLDE